MSNSNEAPKKRYKVMKGGRLRPFVKGQILTYNERTERYYYKERNNLCESPFTVEEIENMPESLCQPLSADGLIKEEIIEAGKKGRLIECWQHCESDYRIVIPKFDADLCFYRLKPKPEYIDVPESVKIGFKGMARPVIVNVGRYLFISINDGLPLMGDNVDTYMWDGYKYKSHIDPTPITEFEDGAIYYQGYTGEDFYEETHNISDYFVYCEIENKMYGFPYEGTYATRFIENPYLNYFRKVTPK